MIYLILLVIFTLFFYVVYNLILKYIVESISILQLEENRLLMDPVKFKELTDQIERFDKQFEWALSVLKQCLEAFHWDEAIQFLNGTLYDYNMKFLGIKDTNYPNNTIIGEFLSDETQFIINNATIVHNN